MEVVVFEQTNTSLISPQLDVAVDELAGDSRTQVMSADEQDGAADGAGNTRITAAAAADATGYATAGDDTANDAPADSTVDITDHPVAQYHPVTQQPIHTTSLHHRTCPYCRQQTAWTGPEAEGFDERTQAQATNDGLFGDLWRSHVQWSGRLADAREREREMETADRQARRWYLRELSWEHERAEMSAQLHVLEDALLGQSEARQAQLRELRQYQDRFDDLAEMRGAAQQQALKRRADDTALNPNPSPEP